MKSVNMMEFRSSFTMYVRADADGARVDLRDALARKYADIGASQLCLLELEPADLAAIFCGCVGVQDSSCLSQLQMLKPKKLVPVLADLSARGALPHATAADHPVGALLAELASRLDGVTRYVEIVAHLAAAVEEPAIRPYLFIPPPLHAPKASVAPLITAPVDDDADPATEDEVFDHDGVYEDDMLFSQNDDTEEDR